MNREEYLHYRNNEDFISICFHHWTENKTSKHKDLSYREFASLFSHYLEFTGFDRIMEKIITHYDKKFNIVKVQTTKEVINMMGQKDIVADETIKVF